MSQILDYLKKESSCERTTYMQVLNLAKEFKMQNMKETYN